MSAIIIFLSTTGLSIVPFIDSNINENNDKIKDEMARYYGIRNSMDMGKLQWELARLFLTNHDILTTLKAGDDAISRNLKHYLYSASNADAFMRNAAEGFRGFNKPPVESKITISPLRRPDQVEADFHKRTIGAIDRNNKLLKDIRDRIAENNSMQNLKNNIYTVSIILNTFGLVLGIFVLKFN